MCGLVGAVGNLVGQDYKALAMLMVFDTVRGMDSTGVAIVERNNKEILVAKSVGTAHDLFRKWDCFDDRGEIKGSQKVVLAHNRAATRGKISEENAHPFCHGNIIGAHNGTLTSTYHLDDANKFDVDSEAIIFNLDKHGIRGGMARVNGAYAITFYNREEQRMYFIRNKERPLHFCRRKDNDVIFWASEPWMLSVALGRSNIAHEEVQEFKEDHLYSFDISDVSKVKTTALVDEGEVEGYKWTNPLSPKLTTTYRTKSGGNSSSNLFERGHYAPWVDRQAPKTNKRISVRRNQGHSFVAAVGDTIEFMFDKVEFNETNIEYLSCVELFEQFEVRIFGSGGGKGHNIKEWNCTWEAKIKKIVNNNINGKNVEYVVVDPRSIVVANKIPEGLKEDNGNSSAMFRGYNNVQLDEETYDKLTSCGCAWCSGVEVDPERICWINPTEYICIDCRADEKVRQAAFIPASVTTH
jgi:predicted glutamine amidotransferase